MVVLLLLLLLLPLLPLLLPLVTTATNTMTTAKNRTSMAASAKQKKRTKVLPPGSMGWPYIGETLKLYTQHPNRFFSSRQQRYGEVFKTHILGSPSIMIGSSDAAKFILIDKAHLFRTTFPSSKEGIIGPHALFFHDGDYHRRLRRLVVSCFVPDSIRGMLPHIQSLALQSLHAWAEQPEIAVFAEAKKYAFNVVVLKMFGRCQPLDRGGLRRSYQAMERGYNSFPIDIAGTPYNAAMKARKHLHAIVIDIINRRRNCCSSGEEDGFKDLLSAFIESKDDNGEALSDEQIADNVIGVLFAAQDTTASVISWLLKYLGDHPQLLQAVRVEHEAIQRSKTGGDASLTYEDTKSMPLSSRVIQETLRLATVISFTFREAVEDVEYKDYIIPKGWRVMPLFRHIHHNPAFFLEPHKFEPARFEQPVNPNTFMPFGRGSHSCPGSELAKLEMLLLLHHLTTKFRWEFVGSSEGVQYSPFPVPRGGLRIRLHKQDYDELKIGPAKILN